MRHDAQTIQADRFIASETEAVGPLLDAGQRCLHETNVREITFQEPRGEVPFFIDSHLVHSVRRVLYGDGISIVHTLGKYIAPAFEHDPNLLDVTCVHWCPPSLFSTAWHSQQVARVSCVH